MNKDRRKVLDLLEFCLEMDSDMTSVIELFSTIEQANPNAWADEELAAILQDRANDLLKETKNVLGKQMQATDATNIRCLWCKAYQGRACV